MWDLAVFLVEFAVIVSLFMFFDVLVEFVMIAIVLAFATVATILESIHDWVQGPPLGESVPKAKELTNKQREKLLRDALCESDDLIRRLVRPCSPNCNCGYCKEVKKILSDNVKALGTVVPRPAKRSLTYYGESPGEYA